MMNNSANGHSTPSGNRTSKDRVFSYLSRLGLDDEELAEVISILQLERGEVASDIARRDGYSNDAATLQELEAIILRPTFNLDSLAKRPV